MHILSDGSPAKFFSIGLIRSYIPVSKVVGGTAAVPRLYAQYLSIVPTPNATSMI